MKQPATHYQEEKQQGHPESFQAFQTPQLPMQSCHYLSFSPYSLFTLNEQASFYVPN